MHRLTSKFQNRWTWLKARGEVLVPIVGLPLFFGMIGWMNVQLSALQMTLVWGVAIAYAMLVLWAPMTLPAKVPQPLTWTRVRQAGVIVVVVVASGLLLQMAIYRPSSQSSSGGGIYALFLSMPLGVAGVVVEGMLPVDLFPVLRRREMRRVVYALVAALFLTTLFQFWSGLFDSLAEGIGGMLGETSPSTQAAISYFDEYSPLGLLVGQLFSAGIEELFFRVGIMTLVWVLTERWWGGLLLSALCFAVYHITLSGMSEYFVQAPVMALVSHFGAGLANGLLYRYRGFTTVVLVHALGNWLVLMLLTG